MNIFEKAKKQVSKLEQTGVVQKTPLKPVTDPSVDQEAVLKEKHFPNQDILSDSEDSILESSEYYDQDVVSVDEINTHNLDFNFAELGEESSTTESKILSINPLNPFSNQIELDLDKLNEDGYITPKHANTMLSNTFRMIKRPIINNAAGKGASIVNHSNMVMVSSSLPGEGKTFSAINLAISLALEKNKHALLIDADVNKPTHHKIFGMEQNRGLTDVLLGKVEDMSEVLYRTNIPSLSIMSAGTEYAHATELLAGTDMEQFIHDVSTRYPDRIVIFDSPPLLLTTESSVLASHMGQVIVVIEAEKTLSYQVKKSLSLLHNEIVMVMLNKIRDKNDAAAYGYGYGYGYGHGQENKDK